MSKNRVSFWNRKNPKYFWAGFLLGLCAGVTIGLGAHYFLLDIPLYITGITAGVCMILGAKIGDFVKSFLSITKLPKKSPVHRDSILLKRLEARANLNALSTAIPVFIITPPTPRPMEGHAEENPHGRQHSCTCTA